MDYDCSSESVSKVKNIFLKILLNRTEQQVNGFGDELILRHHICFDNIAEFVE